MLNRTPSNKSNSHSWWSDALCLGLFFGILYFLFLGARPLFTPDEGRYAEIAREMVTRGDYITPYLNGIEYFEKPALFYWLGAAAIKVGGANIIALRSVNALLGILGCLFTYAFARQLYNRTTGLLAAMILGTSTLYFIMSHMISLDLTVTFFISTALYAFLLGVKQPAGWVRRLYFYGTTLACAFAVLTKGLIGIVFPAVIILLWLISTREWRQLKQAYIPSCILLFLLVTAPWHLLVNARHPEFFYFYFIEQQFLRYTNASIGHYQPNWFFIPTLIVGFFPWSLFLPLTIKHYKNTATELFFAIWAIFIFLFFSFSKSKLIPYILPTFPPLAILTAHYLANTLQARFTSIRITLALLCVVSILIGYIVLTYLHQAVLPDTASALQYMSVAFGLLIAGYILCLVLIYKKPFFTYCLLTLVTGLFLALLLRAEPYVDNRTILPLANLIKPILRSNDDVITFNQYYQDLPFYLGRQVTILNWRNELTFGMSYQDTSNWMINDQIFWQRWRSKKRVFVILSNSEYKKLTKKYTKIRFYIIGKTVNNTLISNQPVTP